MASKVSVDKPTFFKTVGYRPMEHQWDFHNSRSRFRCAVCGRRTGKALAITTPIPTPHGWTTMGALEVGDVVFNEIGEPAEVIATTEVQYGQACYKVTFDDSTYLIADGDHQWLTYDKAARKALTETNRTAKPQVRTTDEIAATLLTTSAKPENNHSILLNGTVEFERQELPLDPYVLGVWLGDGAAGGRISTADKEVLEQFEIRGYPTRHISKYDYYVYGLHTKLREMGLNNVNSTPRVYKKEVPHQYLVASVHQRTELLQGLMDSDGTVDKRSGYCTFDNGNLQLARSVLYLARSLGIKAYMNERIPTLNGKECAKSYRVMFSTNYPVFKLQRKAEHLHKAKVSSRAKQKFITAVEPVDSVPVRCIQVSGENGLYLAGSSFTVTHNTTMAAYDRASELLKPKTLGWIIGPTYDGAAKEFRVMYESLILGMELGRDKRVKSNFNIKQGDMYIEMPWGSRVECRSAAHPEHLVGEGLDWVILSEAAKQSEATWQKYIRPALSDKRGGADFVTTPEGKNWLYKLWLEGRGGKPEYQSWRFPSWVNNEVYPGGYNDPEIQLMKETTIEEWFLQEIAAEFTAVVGRIFGEFAEEDHVLTHKHEFRPEWPNYIAFDWGFANPLAAIEFQVSPRDEIYVWREHYHRYRTLEWHIQTLKERENPPGYHLDLAFGDAADPEAVEYVSQHLVNCMANPESKTWLPGIRVMKRMLKLDHDGISFDDNGIPILRPRYWVDPSCENHIREMTEYKTKQNVGPNEFTGAGVVSNDSSDHSIDAMRYGLMHLFEVGVRHHLNEVYSAPTNQLKVEKRELITLASRPSGTYFSLNMRSF